MSKRRRPSRFPRSLKWTIGGIVGLLALWLGGWLIDGELLAGDGVPRGTNLVVPDGISGIDGNVARLDREGVEQRVAELAVAYEALEVDVSVDDVSVGVPFSTLGLQVDQAATVDAVLAVERRGPVGWTQSLLSSVNIASRFNFDEAVASSALIDAAPIDDPPVEPRMELDGDKFVVVEGTPGRAFRVDDAVAALRESVGSTALAVEIEPIPIDQETSNETVREFAQIANGITSNPLGVTIDDQEQTLTPALLRSWLNLETRVGEPSFVMNETDVMTTLRFIFPSVGGGGADARVEIVDGVPEIIDAVPGTACCSENSPERILDAMIAGQSEVNLALGEAGLERDREWLEGLGIVEVVGEFTTSYTPGQARVTNIRRIAELTQGVLIEPGDTFSVNEFVGRRTRDKGFVSAGVIQDGVFKEDVGGGISQYATTVFNAAFFAGLDFEEYRAHSIYINRYPYGREATLAYGAIDLAITNNTPYGVLLWPTTDSNSITVQLYSTKFVTGEQTGQSKSQLDVACTRVTTQRTRTYEDGREPVVDSVFAVYRPEGLRCDGESSLPPDEQPPETTLPPETVPPVVPPTDPPNTQPPATAPPSTKKPKPPKTDPPATEPPATQPPATQPPATQPPATAPPATQPPATDPPVE